MGKTATKKSSTRPRTARAKPTAAQNIENLMDNLRRVYGAHLSVDVRPDGMAAVTVKKLMTRYPLHADDWSRSLGIKSLAFTSRIKRKASFNQLEAERLAMVAQVMDRGLAVFGDAGKLERWLDRPHMYMEKRKPKELLGSTAGIGLILAEFDRIEAGAFA